MSRAESGGWKVGKAGVTGGQMETGPEMTRVIDSWERCSEDE